MAHSPLRAPGSLLGLATLALLAWAMGPAPASASSRTAMPAVGTAGQSSDPAPLESSPSSSSSFPFWERVSRVLKGTKRPKSTSSTMCPVSSTAQLAYGGGKVLAGAPQGLSLYVIWYGNWDSTGADCTQQTLAYLTYSLMIDSPLVKWWQAVSKYCDSSSGKTVSKMVNVMAPAVYDSGSVGTTLEAQGTGAKSAWKVIQNAVAKGYLTVGDRQPDPNGLFLIIPSKNVKVSGGAQGACGSHSFGTWSTGNRVPYAVVLEPESGSACASPSLNKCPRVDSLSASILEQLAEASTNPFGDAWRSKEGKEIGDLCSSAKAVQVSGYSGTKFSVKPVYDADSKGCYTPS